MIEIIHAHLYLKELLHTRLLLKKMKSATYITMTTKIINWILLAVLCSIIPDIVCMTDQTFEMPDAALFTIGGNGGTINVTTHWFRQKLDHFSPIASNTPTWKQRYFGNLDYYEDGGPIFIYVGGEGKVLFSSKINLGFMMTLAEEYHAAAFMLEHRYYGKSKPTEDISNDNLVYLTIEQALADLAYFITYLREENSYANSKIILFGCSYAANLVAWARMKYPHLIHAAVSSSATIQISVEFYHYYKMVAWAIEDHNPECVNSIRQATDEMKQLLTAEGGAQNLTEEFRLCKPLNVSDVHEVSALFQNVALLVATSVQYNRPITSTRDKIWAICNLITNDDWFGSTPFLRYANLVKTRSRLINKCFSIDMASLMAKERNTSWDGEEAINGGRQYMYQKCTQTGHFQTSKSATQPFGNDMFNLDYRLHLCSQIFGNEFNKESVEAGVNRTNIMYGGENHHITNVLFTYGTKDPWSYLGMKNKVYPHEQIIRIEGGSHCSDLAAETENDSPELLEARNKIRNVISEWLNDRK